MTRRPTRTSAVLLFALLAAVGCSQAPTSTGLGATSRDAAPQFAAAAASGQDEVLSLAPDALPLAESGLSAAEFKAFDADADGRLSKNEQLATYQEVWKGFQAIATAKAAEADAAAAMAAAESGEATRYAVKHSLTLAPSNVEVFIDAPEILPAVHQTLASATQSISMDVFLLGGAEGQKLAELLVKKKAEGVDVRLIHDPGYGLSGVAKAQIVSVMGYLQRQGIAVKSYPLKYMPDRIGIMANRFQIDHNKFLVVDGTTAMIGSMNLIDIGTMNHDVYMRLNGAPALELAEIHAATWAMKGPKTPNFQVEVPKDKPQPVIRRFAALALGEAAPALGAAAPALARVTKTDIDAASTKKVLIENIQNAKKSVHVAIYEFGDVDVADALIAAHKRGVEVKVLADKNAHYGKYLTAFKKINLYGTPNLRTMNRLREAGVQAKWFVPQTEDQELHMKLALFDGERALAGSTNFTYQAFKTFRETGVDVVGGSVPARLEAMFARDWEAYGTPVVKPTFKEKVIATAVKVMDGANLSWW